MKNFKKNVKKILRTILTVVILWSWVYAYTLLQSSEKPQTPMEVCTNLNTFYTNSWYTNKREYTKDLETLQEFKQQALDNLSYKDTVLIVKGEKTDNEWLNFLEDTMKLNLEGQKKVEKPEYLGIDTKSVKTESSSGLDFIQLLK